MSDDMMRNERLERLQELRRRLYQAAEERGSLTDPEVLAISEEADRLIVELQQQQREFKLERIWKKGPAAR
ncbi:MULTISPECIES: aspartyl-phosphate phosphatase Spo0E family protein [unclassified Paenibacillus]|uniref:aspartyl-phosphate phosphatase Spo0E family protein n=1 Tax=unclassified Paenibacillus TaxID=185978 RepID=UPI000954C63E|nr:MULTISPECIES: aspartyl-phosphate phosphatase Spo0E family protein [unclassified Paenibacillus]SIR61606.1 Spo0E like sporulation regulatory protein [Paenibacillus sp. RU4X]SIR70209.1 Spo0E like sporulation regulatory protein [Paenibacillus sp. RU4T]